MSLILWKKKQSETSIYGIRKEIFDCLKRERDICVTTCHYNKPKYGLQVYSLSITKCTRSNNRPLPYKSAPHSKSQGLLQEWTYISLLSYSKVILSILIHWIFSFARDWPKRVTWLNMPPLNVGNIRGISSLHLTLKYAPIFVFDHYLFLKAQSFRRASLLEYCSLFGTDNVRRQICIWSYFGLFYSRQMETIIYLSLSGALLLQFWAEVSVVFDLRIA